MSLSHTDKRSGQRAVERARPTLTPIASTSRPRDEPRRRGPAWWRWLRRGVEVALIGGGVFGLYAERHQVDAAAALLDEARWQWLLAAAGAELSSFVVFARLQRWLLRAGGAELRLGTMVEITLAGNALAVTLPGGAAWSASFAFEQLRRRGAERVLAVWVLLAAGALSSFALFVLLVAGIEWAGGRGPVASLRIPALVLAGIPVAAGVALVAARRIPRFGAAWRSAGARIEGLLRRCGKAGRWMLSIGERFATVRPRAVDWAGSFVLALLNWGYDAATLAFAMLALGVAIPWRGWLVAYALAQITASFPITPGGIGVVEGSLSVALIAYGVPTHEAVASVLLYRIFSFWGTVPIGWAAWGALEVRERRGRQGGRGHHPWAWHHAARGVGSQ